MMKASGTAPTYTHVKLSSGVKGYIASEDADTGTVVICDDKGAVQGYDKDTLHLVRLFWHSVTWLRLNVQEPTWFEHDYRVIRREAVKARLY